MLPVCQTFPLCICILQVIKDWKAIAGFTVFRNVSGSISVMSHHAVYTL